MSKFLPYPHWNGPVVVERCKAFDAWDNQHRQSNQLAGLRLLFGHSRGSIILACRHWPHLLCWQWMLRLEWRPTKRVLFKFWRQGPGLAGGYMWVLSFLWLGALVYHRQASDRIAALGRRYREDAPVIYDYASRAADVT